MSKPSLSDLMNTLPQTGTVEWIGLRPARRELINEVESVEVSLEEGLVGDRYKGKRDKKRQVTLIQAEHIEAIASFLGKEVKAAELRRNIVVRGINLLALKDKTFSIGEVRLEMTGLCHPCSRMEEVLGEGGYNAMRGHGGITARVIQGGAIKKGDTLKTIL